MAETLTAIPYTLPTTHRRPSGSYKRTTPWPRPLPRPSPSPLSSTISHPSPYTRTSTPPPSTNPSPIPIPTSKPAPRPQQPPPLTGLPHTHALQTPPFSTTPTHALALSNIYRPTTQGPPLFVPRDPSCKSSSLAPEICISNKKRHYVARPRAWTGEREIDMGEMWYTMDGRGLLLGRGMEERRGTVANTMETEPEPDSSNPQSGNLVALKAEKEKKRRKRNSSTVTHTTNMSSHHHHQQQETPSSSPLQLITRTPPPAGFDPEILLIFHSSTITQSDFAAPFRSLHTHLFALWCWLGRGRSGGGAKKKKWNGKKKKKKWKGKEGGGGSSRRRCWCRGVMAPLVMMR
ncbi:hypothetical protein BDW02DRAFT_579661 [Decorospora gaudefroyi]|uniref:Uncharacterized protein n=1 Tax=Decorospora gaudefroyi TaxID=184978 RepID=A0A6A5K959_9PLEO|nr:hypothetical protein BDW02DRAFT_579661 [Decorospora gaudefroyi]